MKPLGAFSEHDNAIPLPAIAEIQAGTSLTVIEFAFSCQACLGGLTD